MQPQARAGRGIGTGKEQQASTERWCSSKLCRGCLWAQGEMGVVPKNPTNKNDIFQHGVSHLESRIQHIERESQRTWLLNYRQKLKGQAKLEELAQGHQGRPRIEVRGVLPNFCPFNSCTSQKVTAPWAGERRGQGETEQCSTMRTLWQEMKDLLQQGTAAGAKAAAREIEGGC